MLRKFNIGSKNAPCILLAPLDWGLGHATRCIPIIRYLYESGCEVIIAAEGKQLALLQLEFPSLQFLTLKGYRFKYSNNRFTTIVKIIAQIPGLFWSVYMEHGWLKQLAKRKRIDAVISDNRYGFYLHSVPSILITHQLNIQTPFSKIINQLVNFLNYRQIRAFDSCWVPDLAGIPNFGGNLSHPPVLPRMPVNYLGPLVRFSIPESEVDPQLVLILISGPEPQRSIFEQKLITQAADHTSKKFVFVRGLPGQKTELKTSEHITSYNHLQSAMLADLIAKAALIVSRPGYSTVMEMFAARKKCLFIPTPGQSEQEYLAQYLSRKQLCVIADQRDFSLAAMIIEAEKMQWAEMQIKSGLMEKVLDDFMLNLEARIKAGPELPA